MILCLTVKGKTKNDDFVPYCRRKNERTMILYLPVEGKMKEG